MPMEYNELMRAIGAKSTDPTPTPQYMTLTDQRYEPRIRVWAWVLSKTIRNGHRMPYCVDLGGKSLRIKDAAAELGMNASNVAREFRRLASEGRISIKGTRIFLAGHFELGEDLDDEGEGKGDKDKDQFPPYILAQIKKLSKEQRQRFDARVKHVAALRSTAHAEFLLAVRNVTDHLQDNIFHDFEIERQTMAAEKKKQSPFLRSVIDLLAPAIEQLGEFVQNDLYKTAPVSVQTFVQPESEAPLSLLTLTIGGIGGESSSSAVSYSSKAPAKANRKAEDEELQAQCAWLKNRYPAGHWDDKKSRDKLKSIPPDKRKLISERLDIYLACPRWNRDAGQFIPLASNWLDSYEDDPPPALDIKVKRSPEDRRRMESMAQDVESLEYQIAELRTFLADPAQDGVEKESCRQTLEKKLQDLDLLRQRLRRTA